jgi:cob(I)alamin adenosyltransferase
LYTRGGDHGETSLYGNRRVPKDSPLVEACGTIDELNSLIGVVLAGSKDVSIASSLKEVQRMLFVAGSDCASVSAPSPRLPRISAADTSRLEELTDELLAKLPPLKNFILPGGSSSGAALQLARSVCRRAERRVLTASRTEALNPELMRFLNRLSSYLFNLSRFVNMKAGRKEEVWKGS